VPIFVWSLIIILVVGAVFYWLIILTEGTYLGVRPVAWLYDLTAARYDRIKAVQYLYELTFIGAPLLEAVDDSKAWNLLDVATGTGRVLAAVDSAGYQNGQLYGIDRSSKMLDEAAKKAAQFEHPVVLAQQDGMQLGFIDNSFECVTCLEALEFMPHPRSAVCEMLRVLRPGGTLLLTNRVGADSWFYPGRLGRRGRLEAVLHQEGAERVRSMRWQVDYDLIWARKPDVRITGLS